LINGALKQAMQAGIAVITLAQQQQCSAAEFISALY
jgi:ABC-type sugar transport system substrate-binding protein